MVMFVLVIWNQGMQPVEKRTYRKRLGEARRALETPLAMKLEYRRVESGDGGTQRRDEVCSHME